MIETGVVLSETECKALYDLIDELSGGNARNVFAWDGTDSLKSFTTTACEKVYKTAGKEVPDLMANFEAGRARGET